MAIGSTRVTAVYKDDSGRNLTVRISADDLVTNSGLTIFDDGTTYSPPISGKISANRCRRVYAQGILVGTPPTPNRLIRRAFVCNTTGSLYASNSPQSVTYSAGLDLTTTGRRGEKITF